MIDLKDTELKKYSFAINVTNKCNLKCEYCLMNAFHKDADYFLDMSIETFKKTIDLIAGGSSNDVYVDLLLTGGEVLLRDPEWLEEAISYAALNLGERASIGIQSNMTLVNKDIIKMLDAYDVNFSTSFDTFEPSNDHRKLSTSQRESLLNTLVNRKNKYGSAPFIMVLNEENIDDFEKNFMKLHDLGISDDFACLKVVNNGDYSVTDIKSFCKKVVNNVYKLSLKYGKMERLLEEDLGFMVETSVARENHLCSCGDCTLNSMTIYPDGSIATCFYNKNYPNWHYSNVHDLKSSIFESRQLDTFRMLRDDLRDIVKSNCTDCPIFDVCEGPCWENEGTLENRKPNPTFCNSRKYTVLYTYNFIMNMTEDEMYEYDEKLFYVLNIDAYDLDKLKSTVESNFKGKYLKLCEEMKFDENIYG